MKYINIVNIKSPYLLKYEMHITEKPTHLSSQNDLDNADTSMLVVCSATHKTKVGGTQTLQSLII